MNKYYRIVEFYAEQKKQDQVNIAKSELQRLMETVYQMNFFINVDWIDFENDEVTVLLVYIDPEGPAEKIRPESQR